MEFFRQEYWSGLPCPSPGDPPDLGLNLGLLHWRQILYHLSLPCILWPVISPYSLIFICTTWTNLNQCSQLKVKNFTFTEFNYYHSCQSWFAVLQPLPRRKEQSHPRTTLTKFLLNIYSTELNIVVQLNLTKYIKNSLCLPKFLRIDLVNEERKTRFDNQPIAA